MLLLRYGPWKQLPPQVGLEELRIRGVMDSVMDGAELSEESIYEIAGLVAAEMGVGLSACLIIGSQF